MKRKNTNRTGKIAGLKRKIVRETGVKGVDRVVMAVGTIKAALAELKAKRAVSRWSSPLLSA
jgi:hypothetical protein